MPDHTNNLTQPNHYIKLPAWKLLLKSAALFLLISDCCPGHRGAMACTVAVEALVTQHYDSQLVALAGAGQPALEATIAQFREVRRTDVNSGSLTTFTSPLSTESRDHNPVSCPNSKARCAGGAAAPRHRPAGGGRAVAGLQTTLRTHHSRVQSGNLALRTNLVIDFAWPGVICNWFLINTQ